MWSQCNTKHCKLLIIKLSFPWLFKQCIQKANKQYLHYQSLTSVYRFLKNSHYNQWSCLHSEMNFLLTWYIHMLCCLWWVFTRVQNSVSERAHCTILRCFSDDLSECLWLAVAFITSTESRLIGCNAQRCKHTYKEMWCNRSRSNFNAVNTFNLIFTVFATVIIY